jgi:hypothetical protein
LEPNTYMYHTYNRMLRVSISTKSYLEKYNIFHLRSQHSENLMCLHNHHFWMWPHWTNWKLNQRSNWNSVNIKRIKLSIEKSYKPFPPAFWSWAEAKLIPTTATKSVALSILQLKMIGTQIVLLCVYMIWK